MTRIMIEPYEDEPSIALVLEHSQNLGPRSGMEATSASVEAPLHGTSGDAPLLFMKGMDGSNEMRKVRRKFEIRAGAQKLSGCRALGPFSHGGHPYAVTQEENSPDLPAMHFRVSFNLPRSVSFPSLS